MVAHGYARNTQEAEAFGQVLGLIWRLTAFESRACVDRAESCTCQCSATSYLAHSVFCYPCQDLVEQGKIRYLLHEKVKFKDTYLFYRWCSTSPRVSGDLPSRAYALPPPAYFSVSYA